MVEFTPASIESPYWAGTANGRKQTRAYAMLACEWACKNGYAPYASHLIQTTHERYFRENGVPYVDDDHDGEYTVLGRDGAIAASMAIRERMAVGLMFMDFGVSSGMQAAREHFAKKGIPTKEVHLAHDPEWKARFAPIAAITCSSS